tara:strand:+ start:394 stop:1293 length:900 start_codon:yes stop_codon:yes gene_type:complete
MNSSKPLVIVLLGPTASGKTELAIEIANHFKLDIHNIDSRQMYQYMDIGTAKPTIEQQKIIKHLLINLSSPDKKINVKQFQEIATKSISYEIEKKKNAFLVGGSGLYMNSIIYGFVTPQVPPQENLRKQFMNLGQKECWELLKLCDPQTTKKIHFADQIRTVRALEVFYTSGKTISSQQHKNPPPWKVIELGLDRNDLKDRITQRTKNMYKQGIIEETKRIIKSYGRDLPLLKTMGYCEALSVIDNSLDLDQAIEITTKKTLDFAKRQRKWFRNKNNPTWLNNKNPLKDAIIKIESALS